MMEIQLTKGYAKKGGITALIYGQSGAGKTYLSTTAEAPLILSPEKKLYSLNEVELPFININTMQDMVDVYKMLEEEQSSPRFRTIIIDTLTELSDKLLAEKMDIKTKNGFTNPQKAYGDTATEILNIVRNYKNLDGYIKVFLAKETYSNAKFSQLRIPSFPGQKLNDRIPYELDFCFHLDSITQEDGAKVRFLQTELDQNFVCKTCGGKLDPREPAHLQSVFTKLLSN
jgi:hypothetical protein